MITGNEYAQITRNGSVLLGRLLVCDGHDYNRKHFVFSHIHSDHIDKLGACLQIGDIYASKATMEMLEAIMDDTLIRRTHCHPLKYDESEHIDEGDNSEKLRLIESKHMLGASQIEVLTHDNKKIVYTGDITSEDKPPKNIDTLVIDSTHGTPQFDLSPDKDSIRARFIDALSEGLKAKNKSVLIHANRGVLQEIMSIVSQEDFQKYALLAQKKDVAISKIYKTNGYNMRTIIDEKEPEGEDVMIKQWPWIQFTTSFSPSGKEEMDQQYGIYFRSYNGGDQMKESENRVHFLEGSHANFSALINYIETADPTHIIVDGSRTEQGQKLTNILKGKKFDAICQPT